MREEMRKHISFYYGPTAWDEIVKIEAEMRKKRREAEYAAIERKEMILEWIVGIAFAGIAAIVVGFIVWYIGGTQGKW